MEYNGSQGTQMEEAKLQEFSLVCMESMTIHPTICLFPVSNACKHVQLHPKAAMILQFCVALTMQHHEIFLYSHHKIAENLHKVVVNQLLLYSMTMTESCILYNFQRNYLK